MNLQQMYRYATSFFTLDKISVRVEVWIGSKVFDDIALTLHKDNRGYDLKRLLVAHYSSNVVTFDNIILRLNCDMVEITNSTTLEHIPQNSVIICEIINEINNKHDDLSLSNCFFPSYRKTLRLQDECIRRNTDIYKKLYLISKVALGAVTIAFASRIGILNPVYKAAARVPTFLTLKSKTIDK